MDHLKGDPSTNVNTTEVEESSPRTSTPPRPSEDVPTFDELEESKKGLFAYLKTRNFYIVLAIGYDSLLLPLSRSCLNEPMLQPSARSRSHRHKHLLHTTRQRGYFNPGFSKPVQLRSSLPHLHLLYALPLRHQEMVSYDTPRWLEMYLLPHFAFSSMP